MTTIRTGLTLDPDRFRADFGLFLDVDGTLIDIAPNPDAVVVPASLLRDLALAEERLEGALALISGRTIEDLDRLFSPLRLKASGVHGAEFRFHAADTLPQVLATALPAATWTDLLEVLAQFPGTFAENKSFSFAIHYRAAPGSGQALKRRLDAFLAAHPDHGLTLMPGHYVFEMKRPDINKGAAIARFMEEAAFRGRRPIFVGDDVTDRPGFETVMSRNGLAYSVSHAAPGVVGTFPNPAAVRHWLAALIDPETIRA